LDNLDLATADLVVVVDGLVAAVAADENAGGLTTRTTLRLADEARVQADLVRRLLLDKAKRTRSVR
jgi:hypothetical protein